MNEYPEMSLLAGGLIYSGVDDIGKKITHFNDPVKVLIIHDVLKESGVRGMLFRSELKRRIEFFMSDAKEPKALTGELSKLIRMKDGIAIKWAFTSRIDEQKTVEFFAKYGSPHVQVEADVKAVNTDASKESAALKRVPRTVFMVPSLTRAPRTQFLLKN